MTTLENEDRERLVRIEEGVRELNRRRDDHEERIRMLEAVRNQSAGAMKLLTVAAGVLGGGVATALQWLLHR